MMAQVRCAAHSWARAASSDGADSRSRVMNVHASPFTLIWLSFCINQASLIAHHSFIVARTWPFQYFSAAVTVNFQSTLLTA
jgi:hypothetical protein